MNCLVSNKGHPSVNQRQGIFREFTYRSLRKCVNSQNYGQTNRNTLTRTQIGGNQISEFVE